MQNTARQSKTQDRQTRSYLRLTRQSCRYHGHYTVRTQTCHAGIHYLRPTSKGLYPPALLFAPTSPISLLFYSHLSPMKIPASAACLNTYHNRPTHPVGSYRSLVTAPANQPQFTTNITRGPAGQHQSRK